MYLLFKVNNIDWASFLIHEVSRSHSDTLQSVGLLWTSGQLIADLYLTKRNTHNGQTSIGLLWTSDQPVAQTST